MISIILFFVIVALIAVGLWWSITRIVRKPDTVTNTITGERQCPACLGAIPDAATKCMHCGEDLPNRNRQIIRLAALVVVGLIIGAIWVNYSQDQSRQRAEDDVDEYLECLNNPYC